MTSDEPGRAGDEGLHAWRAFPEVGPRSSPGAGTPQLRAGQGRSRHRSPGRSCLLVEADDAVGGAVPRVGGEASVALLDDVGTPGGVGEHRPQGGGDRGGVARIGPLGRVAEHFRQAPARVATTGVPLASASSGAARTPRRPTGRPRPRRRPAGRRGGSSTHPSRRIRPPWRAAAIAAVTWSAPQPSGPASTSASSGSSPASSSNARTSVGMSFRGSGCRGRARSVGPATARPMGAVRSSWAEMELGRRWGPPPHGKDPRRRPRPPRRRRTPTPCAPTPPGRSPAAAGRAPGARRGCTSPGTGCR